MLGLETALAVTITELVEPGLLSLQDALALLSWRPAAYRRSRTSWAPRSSRARRRTSPCSTLGHEWEVEPDRLASRARNTPFAGRTLKGQVKHTLLAGEPVVIDGEATR